MFLELLEGQINEDFSAEMKSSVSSKTLSAIANYLNSRGVAASRATFTKVPKDVQAKLKRRVKDVEGLAKFVVLIHKQDMAALKELDQLKVQFKKSAVGVTRDLVSKLEDLIRRARGTCYVVDTSNSKCVVIEDKLKYDTGWFDETGIKTYAGNIHNFTNINHEVRTYDFKNYVAKIQEMMRDLDFDAYVLSSDGEDTDSHKLQDERRKAQRDNDPLSPNWNGKNDLYDERRQKAQEIANSKTFRDDVKLVRDRIKGLKNPQDILAKALTAVEVNNKNGVYPALEELDKLVLELGRLRKAVYELKDYHSDWMSKNSDIHSDVVRALESKYTDYTR